MYRFKSQGLFLDRNRCLAEREKAGLEIIQTLLEKIRTVRNKRRQFRVFLCHPGLLEASGWTKVCQEQKVKWHAKQPAASPRLVNKYRLRIVFSQMSPLLLFRARFPLGGREGG